MERFSLLLVVMLVASSGCSQKVAPVEGPTASVERAARRAFDGAPPVIPHPPLGAGCVTCHTQTGGSVPGLGFAPANPHRLGGRLENCRQCHLFQNATGVFTENLFAGTVQALESGERLYPGAPPTIPHTQTMRENCLACHAGPASRPEIRCTHPERANCRQCHLATHPE